MPIPSDNEKNTCPMALTTMSATSPKLLIFEKSGISKNFTPSAAPFRVREYIISPTRNTSSSGKSTDDTFSMPFDTPNTTIMPFISRKAVCHTTGSAAIVLYSEKYEGNGIFPEAVLKRYFITQPPTVQ